MQRNLNVEVTDENGFEISSDDGEIYASINKRQATELIPLLQDFVAAKGFMPREIGIGDQSITINKEDGVAVINATNIGDIVYDPYAVADGHDTSSDDSVICAEFVVESFPGCNEAIRIVISKHHFAGAKEFLVFTCDDGCTYWTDDTENLEVSGDDFEYDMFPKLSVVFHDLLGCTPKPVLIYMHIENQ